MALGKHKTEQQQVLFVPADRLPRSPEHVFYRKLNDLLAEAAFDVWLGNLCRSYYAEGIGRESIPPGTYFRMLLDGYFKGISCQRSIAWRCSDSLSLRDSLAVPPGEQSPDHSSLSKICDRLPIKLQSDVFARILKLADEKKLLKGKNVAVGSTTLEAAAAMKSIVRRDNGDDRKQYVTRLMQEESVVAKDERPTGEELRRYDKNRKRKTVSNEEWVSPTDPDSRSARMKDGTTVTVLRQREPVMETDTPLDIYIS